MRLTVRRRLAAVAVSALLALPLTACAHPPPQLSPQGRVAFTADQAVQRINELENAAIQANAGAALAVGATRTLLEFCVGANQTLRAAPSGWRASVTAAWEAAKRQLPPITNQAVVAAMSAVDVVLATLGGD